MLLGVLDVLADDVDSPASPAPKPTIPIRRLHATGLYGRTPSNTAEELLRSAAQDAARRSGLIL